FADEHTAPRHADDEPFGLQEAYGLTSRLCRGPVPLDEFAFGRQAGTGRERTAVNLVAQGIRYLPGGGARVRRGAHPHIRRRLTSEVGDPDAARGLPCLQAHNLTSEVPRWGGCSR